MRILELSEEIEDLLKTASRGPWRHKSGNRQIEIDEDRAVIADISDDDQDGWPQRDGDYWSDGELIVLLRNNVEKIVQALRDYELKAASDVVKDS